MHTHAGAKVYMLTYVYTYIHTQGSRPEWGRDIHRGQGPSGGGGMLSVTAREYSSVTHIHSFVYYLSVYMYLYTCIHVSVYLYTCVCIHTSICLPIQTHTYIHRGQGPRWGGEESCVTAREYFSVTHIYSFVHYLSVYMYLYTCIHVSVYMWVHAYFSNTYTQTQGPRPEWRRGSIMCHG